MLKTVSNSKTTQYAWSFFILRTRTLSRERFNSGNVESPERDVDDAVGAKDYHETDETVENRLSPICALRLVASVGDKFKHAPDEDDERGGREEKNERINYLRNDLHEELIEL